MKLYEIDLECERDAFIPIDNLIMKLVDETWQPDFQAFKRYFSSVQGFQVDQTGFTPTMMYFLYSISNAHAPKTLLSLGSYCGLATSAILQGAIASAQHPAVDAVVADEDKDKVIRTQQNLNTLVYPNHLSLSVICKDPKVVLETYPQTIDLLFIDVDHPVKEKEDYPAIAEIALAKLSQYGLFLAHDAFLERCVDDIVALKKVIDDSGLFSISAKIPVDNVGIFLGKFN